MTTYDLYNHNKTRRPRQGDGDKRQWPRPAETQTDGPRRTQSEEEQAAVTYRAALAFVDAAEPTPHGGLATAYYNKAGVRLTTLNEVVNAIINGGLASIKGIEMSSGVITHDVDTEQRSQIIDLYQAGQPLTEIVRVTGVKYSLVYFYTVSEGRLDQMKPGPKPRQRIPDKLPLGLMASWRQQGLTPKEMAAKLLEMAR